LESTKIVPVMQILAIPDAAAAKLVRRIQLRQGAGLRLRIRFLSFEDPAQLARQHGAEAGSLLGREGPRPLQKALVDRQCDVLLHRSNPLFILHVKNA
jgi:hypothetical protein